MQSPSDPYDASALPESIRALQSLWKLKAALDRVSEDMEKRFGVTGQQRFLLRFVGLMPGLTEERLAELLEVEPGDLHPDVERLLGGGYLVARAGDPGFRLSSKGALINANIAGTIEQVVSQACDDAAAHERWSFRRMLDRIVAGLRRPRDLAP